jgi:hypothetical protein
VKAAVLIMGSLVLASFVAREDPTEQLETRLGPRSGHAQAAVPQPKAAVAAPQSVQPAPELIPTVQTAPANAIAPPSASKPPVSAPQPAAPTDSDHDGVSETIDNCPSRGNGDQVDHDGDGAGDVCDPNDDHDGLSDAQEREYGTDPTVTDTDADGKDDAVEIGIGTDPNDANS